jgi:hypothetical protein
VANLEDISPASVICLSSDDDEPPYDGNRRIENNGVPGKPAGVVEVQREQEGEDTIPYAARESSDGTTIIFTLGLKAGCKKI